MHITDEKVFRTLRYMLIASLGLVAVLAGVLIYEGIYGLILIMAGGVALLLAIAIAMHARSVA